MQNLSGRCDRAPVDSASPADTVNRPARHRHVCARIRAADRSFQDRPEGVSRFSSQTRSETTPNVRRHLDGDRAPRRSSAPTNIRRAAVRGADRRGRQTLVVAGFWRRRQAMSLARSTHIDGPRWLVHPLGSGTGVLGLPARKCATGQQ